MPGSMRSTSSTRTMVASPRGLDTRTGLLTKGWPDPLILLDEPGDPLVEVMQRRLIAAKDELAIGAGHQRPSDPQAGGVVLVPDDGEEKVNRPVDAAAF